MTKQERLFQAIGGADPALVSRSDKTAPRRAASRRRWGETLAACFAVVLLAAVLVRGGFFRTGGSSGASEAAGSAAGGTAGSGAPASSFAGGPKPGASGGASASAGNGGALPQGDGEFHLVQLSSPEETAPAFMIYVNQEMYAVSEDAGVFTASPVPDQPEGTPPCRMTIAHLSSVSPAQAAEDTAAELARTYASVSDIQSDSGVKGLYLSASDGTAWDDAQAEIWLVEDHRGGVFVLTSAYFTEATEGHGMRFRDMIATFQPVTEAIPQWLTELRNTAETVSRAIFADDPAQAADCLAEGAQVEGYGRDVLAEVSVSSVDCTVDDPQSPETALVHLRFGFLEDSYDSLTLELIRQADRWLVTWSGVEK